MVSQRQTKNYRSDRGPCGASSADREQTVFGNFSTIQFLSNVCSCFMALTQFTRIPCHRCRCPELWQDSFRLPQQPFPGSPPLKGALVSSFQMRHGLSSYLASVHPGDQISRNNTLWDDAAAPPLHTHFEPSNEQCF